MRVEFQYKLRATRDLCVDPERHDTQEEFRIVELHTRYLSPAAHLSDLTRYVKAIDLDCDSFGDCDFDRRSFCAPLENATGYVIDSPNKLHGRQVELFHTANTPGATPSLTIEMHRPNPHSVKPQGFVTESADPDARNVSLLGGLGRREARARAGQDGRLVPLRARGERAAQPELRPQTGLELLPLSESGARFMLVSAAAFAGMTAAAKLVGGRLPVFEIVFVRALFSVVLTAALLRRARAPLLGTRRPLLALRGLFGFCGLSCSFYSVIHLPLAEATLLQFMHPVFTVGARGARCSASGSGAASCSASRSRWWACCSWCGPAFLFGGAAAPLDPFAVAVALSGAFFAADAYVTVRHLARTGEHPLAIVFSFPAGDGGARAAADAA